MFLCSHNNNFINKSVKKLNNEIVASLIENGVNAVGISPCLNVPGLMAHGGDEYQGATLLVRSIRETLSSGLVPVIHGDAGLYGKYEGSSDDHQSMSAGILGGDTLVEIIARNPLLNKHIWKTVFLTDVESVFTKDPKIFPDATLVRNILIDPLDGKVMNAVSASGSSHEHDVTGGLEVRNTDVFLLSKNRHYHSHIMNEHNHALSCFSRSLPGKTGCRSECGKVRS